MAKISWENLQKCQTKKYLLRYVKPEDCLVKRFMDSEEKRTGKRPTSALISCPCSRCVPYFM